MILNLQDPVRVAYKKLKQMVHFDKHPLTVQRRMAEFECEADFEERLQVIAKAAESKAPHETAQFEKWIEAMWRHLQGHGPPSLTGRALE